MSADQEHRDFTRVHVSAEATVSAEGKTVSGKMDDISMKGGFLHCGETLPEGGSCDIALTLRGGAEDISISARGHVVRSSAEGMALEFGSIDPESYEHLRNLVRYNAGDESRADRIDDELHDSLGLKRHEP